MPDAEVAFQVRCLIPSRQTNGWSEVSALCGACAVHMHACTRDGALMQYGIYIGGWGDETNREIVSFRFVRSCARARGVVIR